MLTAAAVVNRVYGIFVSTGVTDIAHDVKSQIQALIKVIH